MGVVLSSLEISPDGYTVRRNGVVMKKPDYMSDVYWFKYEAPRCGTEVGNKGYLFGQKADMPKWGEDERGDGCDGGSCAI